MGLPCRELLQAGGKNAKRLSGNAKSDRSAANPVAESIAQTAQPMAVKLRRRRTISSKVARSQDPVTEGLRLQLESAWPLAR